MNNLHILTDEQLIRMSKEGSETAQEILIEKYKDLVKQVSRSYFIVGADNDDVVQEGMIGLFKAITKFDEAREASFKTFAETCITSQILSAIKGANRMKHQPLNESVSIDKTIDTGEEVTIGEIIPAPQQDNPEITYIYQETENGLSQNDYGIFSSFELKVFKEKMQGFESHEIAKHMGKTEKQIENALQRIKKKIVVYFEK